MLWLAYWRADFVRLGECHGKTLLRYTCAISWRVIKFSATKLRSWLGTLGWGLTYGISFLRAVREKVIRNALVSVGAWRETFVFLVTSTRFRQS